MANIASNKTNALPSWPSKMRFLYRSSRNTKIFLVNVQNPVHNASLGHYDIGN